MIEITHSIHEKHRSSAGKIVIVHGLSLNKV